MRHEDLLLSRQIMNVLDFASLLPFQQLFLPCAEFHKNFPKSNIFAKVLQEFCFFKEKIVEKCFFFQL